MTHRTLTIAGWLTMISAFASIPMAYLAFKLEGQVDPTGTLILATTKVAGTLLFVAITLFLKRLLNRIFNFHDTDKSIGLMIMANVVAGIFVIGGIYISQIKETAGIAALVIMVFQGIVQLQFGYKLLKLQNSLALAVTCPTGSIPVPALPSPFTVTARVFPAHCWTGSIFTSKSRLSNTAIWPTAVKLRVPLPSHSG